MRSTFGGIEISKRSLFAHQTALTTTGHNVANVNTKGYTRQVVNLVAAKPLEAIGMQRSTIPGQHGQSVEFISITRVRERFLDDQFRNQNKAEGDWTVRRDTLEKLETIMNEPSDTGIRTVIEDFWNAWQELSKAPDNMTARAVVKESALAMADAFNLTSQQLDDLSRDLTDNINVKTTQVNSLLTSISRLNEEIYRVEGFGDNANDLRDQRDSLVDDLSKVINIEVQEVDSGYTIRMGSTLLVEGREVQTEFTPDLFRESLDEGDLNSGEMYGLFLSRDYYVAEYQDHLDTLVNTMMTGEITVTLPAGTVLPDGTTLDADTPQTVAGINGLHQMGYILSNPVATAPPLFTTKDGSATFTAANLELNPIVENNLENIAASMRTYTAEDGTVQVVKGNNTMALLIANMRLQKFEFVPADSDAAVINGGTLDEYFRAVIGQLGVQTEEAKRQASNQMVLTEQVDARRQSVSGVSLDEEMSNMIKFQHAYNAAARAMTTFDEMLDKVINGMGVVGR